MSDTTRTRRYVRRTLTPIQKTREMALTLLGVDKRMIATAIGSTETVIFNIFADKHRSPETEEKVIAYLNERQLGTVVGAWERARLRELGFRDASGVAFTPENFGWPTPE